MLSVCVVACVWRWDTQRALAVARRRLERCYATFTTASQSLIGDFQGKHTWPLPTGIWITTGILAGLMLIGWVPVGR
jgi:hypothetical protein